MPPAPIQDKFARLEVSRQRKWQLRQIAKGRCQTCGREASSGRCPKHRGYRMKTVEKKLFRNDTVTMNNVRFRNCVFDNCQLIYSGGATEWKTTRFINCSLWFSTEPRKTIRYLASFGITIPPTITIYNSGGSQQKGNPLGLGCKVRQRRSSS